MAKITPAEKVGASGEVATAVPRRGHAIRTDGRAPVHRLPVLHRRDLFQKASVADAALEVATEDVAIAVQLVQTRIPNGEAAGQTTEVHAGIAANDVPSLQTESQVSMSLFEMKIANHATAGRRAPSRPAIVQSDLGGFARAQASLHAQGVPAVVAVVEAVVISGLEDHRRTLLGLVFD